MPMAPPGVPLGNEAGCRRGRALPCTPRAPPGDPSECRSAPPSGRVGREHRRDLRAGPTDVSLCVMPLFHVHGLVASTLATLLGWHGRGPAPFNPLRFWTVAAGTARHGSQPSRRCSTCCSPGRRRSPRSRPCASSGPAALRSRRADGEHRAADRSARARGVRNDRGGHQMASNPLPPGERRPGSVGPGHRSRGRHSRRGVAPSPEPGSRGEVVVRGPNVISAYADAPEANAIVVPRRLVPDR